MPTSRLKTLEDENASLLDAAAIESQRVQAFLREISHDLRNSLASILTGSEVLLTVKTSPDVTPLIQSMHRQANALVQIIDRLTATPPSDTSPAVQNAGEESITGPANVIKAPDVRKALRILAIDDRRDVLLPLRVLLTNEGHEISEAVDGSSGLEKVATFRPEIVLCDINLPGNLSGLDVARNIRNQSDQDSIYLVAVSGNSQVCDLENSARAGFDFQITKPITVTALRNVIYNRPTFGTLASGSTNGV